MKRWTPAQEAAIYTRGSDLLVAAGAGAGKTAVLVERVLARITDDVAPVDVDHLLVVTFTEAAAAEMRARIAARLEERLRNEPGNHHLERQLLLLPRATIATIHAFCLRVLRQNFERLGLDPAFRVLDENAAAILSFDALDEVLERRFAASAAGLEQAGEGHDDAFLALVDRFGGATGEGLVPLVLSLHRLAMTQPDPEGWLDELLEPFAVPPPGEPGGAGEGDAAATAGAERWLKELRELAAAGIEQALSYVQHAQALCRLPDGPAGYLATLDADAAMLAELRAAADGPWLSFTAALQASSFGRLQALKGGSVDTELRERVKALRERAKRELDSLSRGLGARSLPEAIAQLAELRPMLEVLVQLVREFDERYRRAKEAAGAVDFNDLERLCLKLLSEPGDWRRPSDVARRLADRYVEVIVDEYQDINPVQDAILGLVAGEGWLPVPRRFMVGDVRQSIYRFRLAEPSIFLDRLRSYSPDGGLRRRIDLRDNFRSRRAVLAAVNFLFRQLFSTGVGGLGFGAEAELQAAATYPEPEAPVEVHLLERDPDELARAAHTRDLATTATVLRADEREAVLVARLLRELLGLDGGRAEPIVDPASGARRPAQPGDVAILLRSPRYRAPVYAQILAEHGIPVTTELRSGYLDALEVATVLNLLRVIDNPRRDVALASVLRAPWVDLGADELARIRLCAPTAGFYEACRTALAGNEWIGPELRARLDEFFRSLERWRTQARRSRVGDLLWRLLQETGFLDYVGGMPGGEQRVANLERLLDLAASYDRFGRQGLEGFLRFVERLAASEREPVGATPADEAQKAVRILSIHQSKGLEFPIVIVADLGRGFNREDENAPILIHRRLGLGPRLVDPVAGTRSDTVARLAVRHRLHAEALAEEMRVLYVALTRARERLLLVGSVGDLASQLREWVALAHHRPEPLPDAFVLRARSPLDWIVPCLARHRHGQVLRHHGAFRGLPANPELFADASQWHVRLWRADDVIDLVRPERAPEAGTAGGLGEEGQATTRAEPPPTEPAAGAGGGGDGGVDDEFARFERQDWPPAGGRRFAKLSVTEFQRMAAAGAGEGDEEPAAPWLPPADAAPAAPSPRRPRRLRLDDATAGRVADGDAEPHEVGIATHRALQHLPLAQLPDQPGREAICRCLEQMVARELLTPEEARLVAVDDLTALFATTLGRRLQQAARAGRLRRELAFSLRVPASVLGWAAGGGEDWVLVQGMIDALIVETDHLLVVDFKTDRVSGHQVDQRAERYRAQLGWYVEAARRIFARPVAEAYLYFLAARRAVPWNGGEGVATVRR